MNELNQKLQAIRVQKAQYRKKIVEINETIEKLHVIKGQYENLLSELNEDEQFHLQELNRHEI